MHIMCMSEMYGSMLHTGDESDQESPWPLFELMKQIRKPREEKLFFSCTLPRQVTVLVGSKSADRKNVYHQPPPLPP